MTLQIYPNVGGSHSTSLNVHSIKCVLAYDAVSTLHVYCTPWWCLVQQDTSRNVLIFTFSFLFPIRCVGKFLSYCLCHLIQFNRFGYCLWLHLPIRITYIHTCSTSLHLSSSDVHYPHFLCGLCFPLLHYPIHLVWIGEHHTTHCCFVTFITVKEIPTITNSKSVNESTSEAVYTHTITVILQW